MNHPFRPAMRTLAAVALAGVAGAASAQAVAIKAGTEGAGLEFQYGIGDHFGARLLIDGGTISHHLNKTDVDYDARLRFSNLLALIDWHPYAGSWRFSAGMVFNNNKLDLNGTPSGGTYTLNGTQYPASSVGSLRGTLEFTKLNPYLGTGWGISPRGRGFFGSLDLGIQLQPNHVSLSATCGAAIAATPTCVQLGSDVAAEQARLQDETRSLRYWPVIELGIGWRFF